MTDEPITEAERIEALTLLGAPDPGLLLGDLDMVGLARLDAAVRGLRAARTTKGGIR